MEMDEMIHKYKAGLVSLKAIGLSRCCNHLTAHEWTKKNTKKNEKK